MSINVGFGNRTKLVGDPAAPLTLLVDTGITRATDSAAAIPKDVTPKNEPPLLEKAEPDKILSDDVGEVEDFSQAADSLSGDIPGKF